jgi:hypothetical protein
LRFRKPWSTGEPVDPCLSPPDRLGWQSSRFLADRAETERAFQLAKQLGSVNAAATELGTTWPSLRKAFTRHGLGMPTRNPEAVRQRAIATASRRAGQLATPTLDPVFVALNPGASPAAHDRRLSVASWLQEVVEVAVFHALEERADLGLAEDQRGPLRIPGVPYRHFMAWQPGRLDTVALGAAAPALPPAGPFQLPGGHAVVGP